MFQGYKVKSLHYTCAIKKNMGMGMTIGWEVGSHSKSNISH